MSSEPSSTAPAERPDGIGTLSVVGIGPGLPDEMTKRAKRVIETADCVIVSDLYQAFLREDGTLPPKDAVDDDGFVTRDNGHDQEIIRSTMGRQIELAKVAFERGRAGDDVAHVSGGDPSVYGSQI